MATDTATRSSTQGEGLVPYRLSVRRYLAILEAGLLPERPRVELIEGRLFERMTKNTPHNFATGALTRRLTRLVGPDWFVNEEKSLRIGRASRPEPDIAVVRGPEDRYRTNDPQAKDVTLIVEVADSTYDKDRGPMWRLYAGAGVPTYWVVNLGRRQVEVYSGPTGKGRSAGYAATSVHGEDSRLPVVVDGRKAGSIAVKDILP